jgi:tetratricopeptide (TPR) repeat protein
MRYFLFSLLLLFIACSSGTPENLEQRIDQLIAEDQYDQAIDVLDDADPSETTASLDTLKEKVHLNYGIFLEYRGEDDDGMRARMTGALRQYIEVLKLNPDNQKAISEVEQIMGIYRTMPDKSPGENIMEDLRELGFDY